MVDLIADPFRAARLILSLRRVGVTDNDVLQAMETIDRGAFVDDALADLAFEDCALPIACGQTVPSPVLTAQLLQAMQLGSQRDARVLLVGAGSGYMATVAAELAVHVYAIERYRRLAVATIKQLERLKIEKVSIRHADGLKGWSEQGPYDRIILTGSVETIAQPLLEQLTKTGHIIAPIAGADGTQITRISPDGTRSVLPLRASLLPLIDGLAHAL